MRFPSIPFAAIAVFTSLFATVVPAQKFDEKFEHWPVDLTIKGTLIVDCGMDDDDKWQQLLARTRGKKALVAAAGSAEAGLVQGWLARIQGAEIEDLSIATFPALSKASMDLKKHDLVILIAGKEIPKENELSAATKKIREYLANGKTLIVDKNFGKVLAKTHLSASDLKTTGNGTGLIPDCVMMTDFTGAKQQKRTLLSKLAANPRMVGIGVEDETAMVLSGRKIRVLGKGSATFMLMANDKMPIRTQTISEPTSRRQAPEEWLVDLTEWRRDAIDRTIAPFPPASPPTPNVENGTLVIVGGGGMPRGLFSQFVELAGGKDKAKIVYVPCSERDDVGEQQRTVEMFKRLGVKHATFIHTKDRNQANTDEEFLEPLKDATGIWFGGGRQWNFADSYYGTKAHKLMKDVLKRGGVVGGSSAGASIQARYLARATPIGNFRIMAPGYERGGLGFIGGVAIDQHFSQRGRQKDMTQLVNRYPQMLGIGLDEATAIIVQKSSAKVVGRGRVFFYDRNLPVYPNKPDYVALPAGSEYDLAKRKVVKDTSENKSSSESKSKQNDGEQP